MSKPTRRNFLHTAGSAAALPAAGAAEAPPSKTGYRRAGFSPSGAPRRISDNLYVFEDTCNVYVIRDGSSCVLIDFGSGKVLDYLSGLGISKVDWVLHTHHHRDQCQGDWKAVERGIPIAVPAHEKNLFADARNFWRNRRVFHLYYMRNDFNTVTEDIPVSQTLTDYSTFRWNKTDFFIQPTPGHTLGAITLLATVDGRKVAFSGDLMYAPGKIQTLYDTQVNYSGKEGIDMGIYSLSRLREQKPAMLCPSHGEPLNDPDSGMAETIRRLTDYCRFWGDEPVEHNRPVAVSRHLIAHHQTNSSFYTILSDSGKALFIDYGSASGMYFNGFLNATPATDRIRFVEHSIGHLKRNFGMKSIDVVMPTHMHDDHINGFPHLARHFGTRIWCYENMVDILENPRGQNLGCTLGEPVQVARSFKNGEKFKWEEFEFEIAHSPGHTEYQMALFTTLDGSRVAFTGDAIFQNPLKDGTLRHNLIFRNHVENDSHLKSIRAIIDREPTLIAPGHGQPYQVDQAILLATEQKLRKQQQFFTDLLPEGETDFGLDPSWVKIYPYQILLTPGVPQTIEIRVQNYNASPMKIEAALVAPSEWRIEPDIVRLDIPARSTQAARLTATAPKSWNAPGPRFAIAADVVRDGKYLGEITEAVVEMAV